VVRHACSSDDIILENYVLQVITPSGAQLHIYRRRNVIKHKHTGYLSADERTAYQEVLMWLEQATATSLQRAIAILEGVGFEVVLVS
jgi:hypothetical protein